MARPTTRPWVRRYAEDRDAVLLSRVRWCVGLSLLGTALMLGQLVVVGAREGPMRFVFPAAYSAVCLVTIALSYHRASHRRAMELALGFVLLLTGTVTANFVGVRAYAESVPGTFVAIMMGVTLLLPWGARAQAVASVAALAGYATVVTTGPNPLVLETHV